MTSDGFRARQGCIPTLAGVPHDSHLLRVVLVLLLPRVEGFSEFLQNALAGLTVQSLVFAVSLQLAFQLRVVGDLARFIQSSREW